MNCIGFWMAVTLMVAGCATRPPAGPADTAPDASAVEAEPADDTAPVAQVKAESLSPLQDFNFKRGELPDVLLAAMAETYAEPPAPGCAGLVDEIAALDRVLGEDLDLRPATGEAEGMMVRALVQAIRGMIPYRGVLRFVTGANRRERLVAAAIAAGSVRRGYLKGLGEARGCEAPAKPVRAAPKPAEG